MNAPVVSLDGARVAEIQAVLRAAGLDGWLLYDFHGRNPVASAVLGLTGALSRRYFVLIPRDGEPRALTHAIEQGPWRSWPWGKRTYAGWRELEAGLAELLSGCGRVALETSPRCGVPTIDLVPAGAVELVRGLGVEVVSSGELVARFHSRWTPEQLAGHRAAAVVLAEVAREAFEHAAAAVREGRPLTEGELAGRVREALGARGLAVDADCIVAVGARASDPHYAPEGQGAEIRAGELLLVDLWGKRSDADVFADQTWMGYLGERVPDPIVLLWNAVRDARDAGVAFLRERAAAGATVYGYEVDDVVRGLITSRGYGQYFVHRTGHSIDRELHGGGANLDGFETWDDRPLVPGTGFSIEPGIYIPGVVGLRSEIDVYWGEGGPEVTTPDPQAEIPALLAGR